MKDILAWELTCYFALRKQASATRGHTYYTDKRDLHPVSPAVPKADLTPRPNAVSS